MKMATKVSCVLCLIFSSSALKTEVNPIGKVVQLLSDLEGKIIGEGEKAQKIYEEFSEWCEDRNRQLGFEIKTGKAEVAELTATIEKASDRIAALNTKIDELSVQLATDEADLKAATEIRAKEAADFAAAEKELVDIINTLERAIAILTREMAKSGASMLQLQSAKNLVQALQTMVEASLVSSADASRLQAFVQSSDDESGLGAPDATVYAGHGDGIIDTLQSLLEKAQTELADARKKETTAIHNFEMLKQSLEDSMKFGDKDMADAKQDLSATTETKAIADGDLAVTQKELDADIATDADLHHNCMTKAQEFEDEVKSRAEELKALATAKKVIKEKTGGAESLEYGLNQVSFVQVQKMSSGMDLANFEAVRFVRDLARKQGSAALAQLSSQMASAMRYSDDPFGKVKGLISDMISRLEADAAADASHKAYCDKEFKESNVKKDDKTAVVEKLTTKIDQMSALSVKLKEEVATLQKDLAALAKTQVEMDKLRKEENDALVSNKADMDMGLEGVKMALKVLREYYGKEGKAHTAADGASSGIIGLLEVIESDFTKSLAEMISTEESAQATYDAQTKENEIEKTTKDQDVKYKTKEAAGLDKAVAEAKSDLATVQAELDAVLEYLEKLHKECDEVAETYAERKARREAEIAGLKEALTVLESETALVQRSAHRTLRGSQR